MKNRHGKIISLRSEQVGIFNSVTYSQTEIIQEIKDFYTKLFKITSTKSSDSCTEFLNDINLPRITQQHKDFFNKPLTLAELENSIKNSQNGKKSRKRWSYKRVLYSLLEKYFELVICKSYWWKTKRSPLPLSKASNHKTSWEKKGLKQFYHS